MAVKLRVLALAPLWLDTTLFFYYASGCLRSLLWQVEETHSIQVFTHLSTDHTHASAC